MIDLQTFSNIDQEVKFAVNEAFDFIKDKTLYYTLFLAQGQYRPTAGSTLNPHLIDYRVDRHNDKDRLDFLIKFLESFYSFTKVKKTDDDHQRIHMELMVYSHIWEAKLFLKQLYRIASIANGDYYPWEVEIPDIGKHDLIRFKVRDRLLDKGLSLGNVIKKSFHTSLRNAFAHSDYHFSFSQPNIVLTNWKGVAWELREITFNDWSIRFVYSALLSYYIQNTIFQRRATIVSDLGKSKFTIMLPISKQIARVVYIYYDQERDSFNFANNV